MYRTETGWIGAYQKKGALWIHDGDSAHPHALLASRNHSDGYFNSRPITEEDVLLREAVADLLELFVDRGGDISGINGVVGPQTGATKLAHFMSKYLFESTGYMRFSLSPAKGGSEAKKEMVFREEDRGLLHGNQLLLVEDVLTTGGSVDLTAEAAVAGGGKVLPYVLVLVNRSGQREVSGKQIIALIDRPMQIWTPEKCPLCKNGSKAILPKDNWVELAAA